MTGIYFYRNRTIWRHGNGWIYDGDFNVYKTIDDCKNAIDRSDGGFTTAIIPKRFDKPIKIIGKYKPE